MFVLIPLLLSFLSFLLLLENWGKNVGDPHHDELFSVVIFVLANAIIWIVYNLALLLTLQ